MQSNKAINSYSLPPSLSHLLYEGSTGDLCLRNNKPFFFQVKEGIVDGLVACLLSEGCVPLPNQLQGLIHSQHTLTALYWNMENGNIKN